MRRRKLGAGVGFTICGLLHWAGTAQAAPDQPRSSVSATAAQPSAPVAAAPEPAAPLAAAQPSAPEAAVAAQPAAPEAMAPVVAAPPVAAQPSALVHQDPATTPLQDQNPKRCSPQPPAPVVQERNPVFLYASLPALLVGVVGVGVGGYYLYQSHSSSEKADSLFHSCPQRLSDASARVCSGEEAAAIDVADARSANEKANSKVGFVVGGVGLGVGAALLTVYALQSSSPNQERASGFKLTPWVTHNGAGVSGQF